MAGILGYAFGSSRIRGSTASTADPGGRRAYLGGPSVAIAARTVFLETPNTRAIFLIGMPNDLCNLRISAQSSTDGNPFLLGSTEPRVTAEGVGDTGSFFRRRRQPGLPQNAIGPAEFAVVSLELRDLLRVAGAGARPVPLVDLGLGHQFRSGSGLIPSCPPIRDNAPDRDAGSLRASTASRVARSRSSSGYFRGAPITGSSRLDGLHQTRHETCRAGM